MALDNDETMVCEVCEAESKIPRCQVCGKELGGQDVYSELLNDPDIPESMKEKLRAR
jgi:hypothetical protein